MAEAGKRIAVTTEEGLLINQHLGRAAQIHIFDPDQAGLALEVRDAPGGPHGPERWDAWAKVVSDCDMVLTEAAGPAPVQVLAAHGIKVIQTEGLIDEALSAIAAGEALAPPRQTRSCSGGASGMGCG